MAKEKAKQSCKCLTKTEMTLVVNYVMAVVVTVAVAIYAMTAGNLDCLVTLACAWIAETAVFSGFYCWKEKNANRQKYAQQWQKEISATMSPEEAARFAEIVLKD